MAKPHAFEDFPHYFPSLDSIIHYTCNPPSKETLNKYGIKLRGKEVDTDPAGFLEIPLRLYKELGYTELEDKDVLKINCEHIMRKLK
jgi:predicted aspartyl protease